MGLIDIPIALSEEELSVAAVVQQALPRLRAAFVNVEENTAYAKDPAKWVWDKLGYELKGIQPAVLQSVADGKDTLVRSGHKCGKTFLQACAVLWWLGTHPMSKVPTTAPGERQLKYVLWAEISHLLKRWDERYKWELTMGMHLYNKEHPGDWFALGVYSNKPGNVEGFHTRKKGNLLVVIDEAKGVEPGFFDAVHSMQGLRLMTSVPPLDGRGYFAEACTTRRANWNIFHMSSVDSPFVERSWLEKVKKDWGEGTLLWKTKVEGELPEQDVIDSVISPKDVDAAQDRWNTALPPGWKPSIGCDVARFGDDKTVNVSLRGKQVGYLMSYQGRDTMWTVGALREMAEREAAVWNEQRSSHEPPLSPKRIPIYVDDTGVGGGVTDRLRELEYNVIPINFGARARDPKKYVNMRNELWFELSLGMKEIALPPNSFARGDGGLLVADLCAPMFRYTSDGRRMESKEETKKRLGRSPDFGDALALAWRGQMKVPERKFASLESATRESPWRIRGEYDE